MMEYLNNQKWNKTVKKNQKGFPLKMKKIKKISNWSGLVSCGHLHKIYLL